MDAVVISNKEQFEAYQAAKGGWKGARVFCDNSAFYPELEARGMAFEKLDEFLLQDDWAKINAWGCGKAAGWIRLWNELDNDKPNPAEVIFLQFGYILTQALKNLLLADYLIQNTKNGSLTLFESVQTRRYPGFSGNAFLNHFLKEAAERSKLPHTTLKTKGLDSRQLLRLDEDAPLKKRGQTIKGALRAIYAKTAKVPHSVDVLVYGSLRHLGGLAEELASKGLRLGFYDFDLHRDQLEYCRKRGFAYLLPEMFAAPPSAGFAQNWRGRFERLLRLSAERGYFSYQSRDLSEFVRTQILSELGPYLENLAKQHALYGRLADQTNPKALLVDEDFAPQRSFFVSFMTARGIASTCVSHATLAVDFKVPSEDQVFAKSITLVQSELERSAYTARGWNPSRIQVSGVPRFDGLVRKTAAAGKAVKRPMRLLWVGGGLYPYTPDSVGYLGCHVYCLEELQKKALNTVLEAIQGLNVRLVIKPHDSEDAQSWGKLAKNSAAHDQVDIVSSSANFGDLLLSCDALALSFWSTTMIEAAIVGKPAFYVDIPPQKSALLAEWEKKRHCRLFQDSASLRNGLQKFIDGQASPPPSVDAHALGLLDGQGTKRAADTITSLLSKKPKSLNRQTVPMEV